MLNINFVPDDYVRNNEDNRTNMLCLVLFLMVMAGLGGIFGTIRIRQRALAVKEGIVNEKISHAQKAIKQLEQLQSRRKAISSSAITTAKLVEVVPRSVLLAVLTNSLPRGTSLLKLKVVQKESKNVPMAKSKSKKASSKYEKAKAKASKVKLSREKMMETHISIEGIAPSDLQVARYIERLGECELLDNVGLVESKEYKYSFDKQGKKRSDKTVFRQFKLTAMLANDAIVSNEFVEMIAYKGNSKI